MSYKKAAQILPDELVRQIQQYVDGEAIYIPRADERRRAWGDSTVTRRELRDRNESIYREYLGGATMAALAQRYFLSLKSIQRIICTLRRQGA